MECETDSQSLTPISKHKRGRSTGCIRVVVGAVDSADRVIVVDWSATLTCSRYVRGARDSELQGRRGRSLG
jgi:hypothetical protein